MSGLGRAEQGLANVGQRIFKGDDDTKISSNILKV